jgi:hypothetical protein
VLRKRDHDYMPEKLGPDGLALTEEKLEELEEKSAEETTKKTTTTKPTLNSSSKP